MSIAKLTERLSQIPQEKADECKKYLYVSSALIVSNLGIGLLLSALEDKLSLSTLSIYSAMQVTSAYTISKALSFVKPYEDKSIIPELIASGLTIAKGSLIFYMGYKIGELLK